LRSESKFSILAFGCVCAPVAATSRAFGCVCAPVATTSRTVNRNRETACACEEGAPAERATAREAGELLKERRKYNTTRGREIFEIGKFLRARASLGRKNLKSEKNSALENNFSTVAEGENFRKAKANFFSGGRFRLCVRACCDHQQGGMKIEKLPAPARKF
jgi:hypothetical protein